MVTQHLPALQQSAGGHNVTEALRYAADIQQITELDPSEDFLLQKYINDEENGTEERR